MRVRLIGVLAVALVVSTALSVQPAGAEPVERPTEPRCFVPFVGSGRAPTLEFENIESAKRIAVRYDDKWVTTLRNPITEWTAPSADLFRPTSFEIVVWPGGERVRCSGVPVIAQLDLGPDNRGCSYVEGFEEDITIWGDFRGVTHVRNQAGWLARLPDDSYGFSDKRLADSQAYLRYRGPGVSGSVDIECGEPIVPIRFVNGGDPIARPASSSLDNDNFSATLLGQTVLVENKQTGQIRSYRMSFDNQLIHISADGRYLHWYREGDPDQAEAADLRELRRTGSTITTAGVNNGVSTGPKTEVTAPKTEVAAATTARAATYVQVSTNGRANGGGFSNARIRDALSQAKPGTVFQFAPGTHQPINVSKLRGNEGNPIVIAAADNNNRPTFSDNSYSGRAGIELSGAQNVEILNVNIRKSMWGIRIEGSSGIRIDSVTVADIGQEGIRITQRSSHVIVQNSTIKNTGRRPGKDEDGEPFSLYGEGIYLGTGTDKADEVHHVTIDRNTISETTAEAIDVKRPVRDVEITNNTIQDIRTGTSGAIAIHIVKNYSAANPNIQVNNNTISDISTTSGHRDGVGIVVGSSVDVIGNRISNTQHYAIRIDDDGPQGNRITANVRDNTFSNPGIRGLFQAGKKAKVNAANNRG